MIEGEEDPRFLVREEDGGEAVVLTLRESYINYATSDVLKPQLKQAIGRLVGGGRTRFVLDLTNVGVMDSCGLAAIISVRKYVDGRGGTLVLSGMSTMIQRLFAITGLAKSFDIFPSANEAVRAT
ncbi:MAG: STAS domain-containing protein [Planctomycetota bacterium]|jgi:anti-sigma B factor antagonist